MVAIPIVMLSSPSSSLPSTEEIEHKSVLKDVMGNCGTLRESLAHFGCRDIYNFLSLTLSEIDSLTKPDPSATSSSGVTTQSSAAAQSATSDPVCIPLLLAERSILKAFKGYVWWYQLENGGKLPTFMVVE